MKFYSKTINSVLNELETNENGLNKSESSIRLSKHGQNKLPEDKKTSLFVKFLMQFKNIMIIILLIAAGVSVTLAFIEKTYSDLFEGGIIFFIVILNAIIGVVQEQKAEDALKSLKQSTEPFCKVIRDGKLKKIKTSSLTIGDIVILEAGDIVPADLRLLETHGLKCDESALTGESVAVNKDAEVVLKESTPLAERKNMAFSSTVVSFGRGKGVVTEVGLNTEIGKIAKIISNSEKDLTPIEKSIKSIGNIITIAVLVIAVIIFLVEVFFADTIDILNAFLVAVTLAVAAIPESLPAVITIIMALGVQSLAKKGAIVKRLLAVETLGSCEIICSDKTGTLTQNKMIVQKLSYDFNVVSVGDKNNNEYDLLTKAMALCNDSFIGENGKVVGDPTETALLEYNIKNKVNDALKYERIYEIPFDSNRKLMTVVSNIDNCAISFTKGAFDSLIKRCSKIVINGKIETLNEEHFLALNEINTNFTSKALRVLGFAFKAYEDFKPSDNLEDDLIFIGFAAMFDPPRVEAKDAIKKCFEAGLKPIMITGDHQDTAFAIAKELNIAKHKKQVITGEKLDKLNDKELSDIINEFTVFARVSPEHKVRIVKAFKKQNKIVAMTGDGVNDAPSLKIADIGVGMGITGTDVTKSVADMIVTDDNFATIVVAIEEGRKVYSNIQKTIQFLLSTNIVEVVTMFFAIVFFPNYNFLIPAQILFINLVTDSLPAFALGVEKADSDVMKQKPRRQNQTIFSNGVLFGILYQSAIQVAIVMFVYIFGITHASNEVASTMVFMTISFMQLLHSVNCKSQKSIFEIKLFNNKAFNLGFLATLALNIFIFTVPIFRDMFNISVLNTWQWIMVITASLSIIPLVEIVKLIKNSVDKKKKQKEEVQNTN